MTPEDMLALIERFLPPGSARAEVKESEFIVYWSSTGQPGRVFTATSTESFNLAFHELIAKCTRQFLADDRHAARERRDRDGRASLQSFADTDAR